MNLRGWCRGMNKYSCSLMQDKNSINRMLDRDEYKAYKFIDVFDDITSKGTKIKTGDYLEYGEYPIIDQGSAFISGYLNDNTNLLKDFPLIVFGDHTRCLKYVDFPIYLGADGVKVLKNKLGEDRAYTRFLYYYLKNINIPNTGYNRHFKYLKEVLFVLPPLETQKKIVEVLDKVQALIDARKEQIRLMDELVKSRFIEMFGDPVVNEKKWKVKKLHELVTPGCTISYGIVQTGDNQSIGVPVFRPIDIVNNVPELNKLKKTTEEISGKYKKTILQGRELLITVRANIGDTYIADERFKGCNVGRGIVPIRTDEKKIGLEFLKYQLDNERVKNDMKSKAKGITLIQLNMEDLRNINLILPNISIQKEYVDFAKKAEGRRMELQTNLNELIITQQALMQQYFG